MKRELAYGLSRVRRGPLLRLLLWSVPEAVPAALFGLAIAHAVDDGFLSGRTWLGLAWVAAILPAGVVSAAGSRQVLRALAEIVEPMRDDLVRRVVSAALVRAVGGRPDDGAVARLTRQVEVVRDSFAGLLLVVRGFAASVAGAFTGLLALSLPVALLVVPPFLVGLAGFAASLGLAVRRQRASIVADERLAAAAVSIVSAARDVMACGAGDHAVALVGESIDEHAEAERGLARTAVLRAACFAVGGWIPLVAVLAAVPWLTAQGMSTGAVLGACFYVLFGLQPALNKLIGGISGAGLRYSVTLRRLLDLPVEEPPIPAGSGNRVAARGISFAYGRHSQPLFRDLTLTVGSGDHLAVIGASGIGKSTLASILCGLRTPTAGEVHVADRVLIPQEAYVFSATVWDNLVYHYPAADESGVIAAASAVGALPLIEELGGLHAVADPGRLSAGQRQLIALARAYLSPAPIAILDEATCHLDPAAEAVAENAFAQRPGGLIVIAHRTASALRAKQILLLDGAVAMLGSHDTLTHRSSQYRELMSGLTVQRHIPRHRAGSAVATDQ